MSSIDGYQIDLNKAANTVTNMDTLIEDMKAGNNVRSNHVNALRAAWGDGRGTKAVEKLGKLFNVILYIAHDLHNVADGFAKMADAYREVHEPERPKIQCVSTSSLDGVGQEKLPIRLDEDLFLSMDYSQLKSMASTASSDMGNKVSGWITRVADLKTEVSGNGNMAEKASHIVDRLEQIKGDLTEFAQQFTDFCSRLSDVAEAVEENEKQLQGAAGYES